MNPPSLLETPVVRSDDSAIMKSETAGLNRADRRKEARAIRIADKKEARRRAGRKAKSR